MPEDRIRKPEWHQVLITRLDAAVTRLTDENRPLEEDDLDSTLSSVVTLLTFAWEVGVSSAVAHRIALLHDNMHLLFLGYDKPREAKLIARVIVDFKCQSEDKEDSGDNGNDDFMMPGVGRKDRTPPAATH